jgi:hypothetical protein
MAHFFKLPCWTTRSKSTVALSCIKSRFGTRSTIFDRDFGGSKVALTMKRSEDFADCVFSNYNISESLKTPLIHIRDVNISEETKLWKW